MAGQGMNASLDGDDAPVRRLNLNLLYPLDAILHAPTLTEAGRRVFLSQPAMSHALRRLRDHFGDDLVTHAGGDQHLTPLGLALRDEVRRVMREVEGTFNYSLDFDPLTSTRTLAVAAPEAIEQMLLGAILKRLSSIAPFLTVDLMPLDINDPRRSLDDGADLLLLPSGAALPGQETVPILTDPASCMIWSEHPELADCNYLTEAQYRAARHIIARNATTPVVPLDEAGVGMLKDRRIAVRTTSQATLPNIVTGSDLMATGSSWLFQYYASLMPLKVLQPPFECEPTLVVAQWAGHRRRDPMLTWFVDQIQRAAAIGTGRGYAAD